MPPLSLAKEALRFKSGQGTWQCKKEIENIENYLQTFQDRVNARPEYLIQELEVPEGYEPKGIQKNIPQNRFEVTFILIKET